MADAKRCDRCKNFYMADDTEMYGVTKITAVVSTGIGGSNKTYDLCPKCSKEFKNFMHNLSIKEEPKGEE